MSQDKIIVGHEELFRFIREALEGKGARPEDAAVVADGLVWANLRGIDGHGVSRLPLYLRMIERGEIDVAAKPRSRTIAPRRSCSIAAGASARWR